MVVGLIDNKVQLKDTDKILSSALYSSITIRDNKKCLKTNLILVPHSLTSQWDDAFGNSKLKYYVITKRKDIDYLEFDDYIEDEYETGMNSISEQEEKNRIKEDEVYDDVYDKVYQRELSKIEDSEYILEQLGGYSKPTVSNLFKRTRKLPRVVK